MRKQIFTLLALACLTITSCTDDDLTNDYKGKLLSQNEINVSDADNSRIYTHNQSAAAKRFATRATTQFAHMDAPTVPASAVEASTASWSNTTLYLEAGRTYKISSGKAITMENIQINGTSANPTELYIEDGAVLDALSSGWFQINTRFNVYVLQGAKLSWGLDYNGAVANMPKNTFIYNWGTFKSTNGGVNVAEGAGFYTYAPATALYLNLSKSGMESGFKVSKGGELYCEVPVTVDCSNVPDRATTAYVGAYFAGDAQFEEVFNVVEGNMYMVGGTATFNKCATIDGYTSFRDANNGTINANMCLNTDSINMAENTNGCTINLQDALLRVNSVTWMNADNTNAIVGVGDGYSAINIHYFLIANYKTNANTDLTRNLRGNIGINYDDIVGVDWNNGGNSYVSLDSNTFVNQWGNTVFYNVLFGQGVKLNDPSVYLPATDCRPEVGVRPVEKISLVPLYDVNSLNGHTYSATGLDFDSDKGLVYMSWHYNPNHGTALYNEALNDTVRGYIDIFNYNTKTLSQTTEFKEFRFNHILLAQSDTAVYAPATSNKIGASMARVSVNQTSGLFSTTPEAYRVKLWSSKNDMTGGSGNCVARVGANLVVVSGRNIGSLDIIPIGSGEPAYSLYTGKYMGKFVYYNKSTKELLVLHDTENGTVDIFTGISEDMSASELNDKLSNAPAYQFNVGSLVPRGGKQTVCCDANFVYVTRGENGFVVYNRAGSLVASSARHANCIDVDDNYIYAVADGSLDLYKKATTDGDEMSLLCTAPLTETNSESTVINRNVSANFVRKGPDGNIYIAYGINGLRVYKVK